MKAKLFQVGYTKKIGGQNIINVKATNKQEALRNAKNMRFTGKNFYVIREIKSAKVTAVGGVGAEQTKRNKLRQRGKYRYNQ